MDFDRLLTVSRMELLWNLRKRKIQVGVVIIFAMEILVLSLPKLLQIPSEVFVVNTKQWALFTATGIHPFFTTILAVLMGMDSISGEFEQETIITLSSKPVSRTEIFLGKLLGCIAILTLFFAVDVLVAVVGANMVYGAQESLERIPIIFIALIYASTVFLTLSLMIGTFTKRSTIAAFGGIGIYFALDIVYGILYYAKNYGWLQTILLYWAYSNLPGLLASANFTEEIVINIAKATVVLAVYISMFLLLALHRFKKMDIITH